MSAERLFDEHPRIYFWTVTFACVHDDWRCAALWRRFLNHVREVVGRTGWGGLRVTELHKEHGVHYHFLCTERLAVDLVRRIGRCHGIGRISVRRADRGAVDYLAKYLSKQRDGALTEKGRNCRRWGCFGSFKGVRVRDIRIDTAQWRYRRAQGLHYLGWVAERMLSRIWEGLENEREFGLAWQHVKMFGVPGALDMINRNCEVKWTKNGAHLIGETWRGYVRGLVGERPF